MKSPQTHQGCDARVHLKLGVGVTQHLSRPGDDHGRLVPISVLMKKHAQMQVFTYVCSHNNVQSIRNTVRIEDFLVEGDNADFDALFLWQT